MIKLNKNSSNYFVLFFIIVVFGFISVLNITYNVMQPRIQEQKNIDLKNSLQTILPCDNFKKHNLGGKNIYYCINSDSVALHLLTKNAYAGPIQYLVEVSLNDGFIKNIHILNHTETPGLGSKITGKDWLNSLANKSVDKLKLKQDGGQIDTFAAASLTPKTLLDNLQENITWVIQNKEQLLLITKKIK